MADSPRAAQAGEQPRAATAIESSRHARLRAVGGPLAAAQRSIVAVLAAYAAVGVLASLHLLSHVPVPDWVLPAAVLVGIAAAAWHRPEPSPPSDAPPRWVTFGAAAVVAAIAAILAWSALATGSRHWDGVVAWDLKAAALTAAPTLEQPFFRDPTVYSHSRDYPLLQPLALALAARWSLPGRLLFPAAYLVLVAAVVAAARRTGAPTRRALLFGVACGVTPMLVAPTSGGFDSGYADGVLATALAALAFGVTARVPIVVALAAFVAAMQKPEGLPYAGLAVAALWQRGDAACLRAAAFATAAGGALVLALQRDIQSFGRSSDLGALAAAAALGAALLVAADTLLRRRPSGRLRTAMLALGLALGTAALACAAGDGSALGAHFEDDGRLFARLRHVPQVLLAMAEQAWVRGRFGLTFFVPLVLVALARRERRPTEVPALAWWLLLLVPLWCAPFLLSPLDNLDHHLRSTMPRLLLHACGIVWIWSGVQRWPEAPRPS